jgi:hypothetical protein
LLLAGRWTLPSLAKFNCVSHGDVPRTNNFGGSRHARGAAA